MPKAPRLDSRQRGKSNHSDQSTIDNSAAYIKSWIGKFKDDKKILLMACSMAQKAVDYILEHQTCPKSATGVKRVGELAEKV